jgi:hypothetical protein
MFSSSSSKEVGFAPLGVDPIQLNHFFDLLTALWRAPDFDALGDFFGLQLRFVLDFESCYLIHGDPRVRPLGKIYSSTSAEPRPTLISVGQALDPHLDHALADWPRSEAGDNSICMELVTNRGRLGARSI